MIPNCQVWSAVTSRFLPIQCCIIDGGVVYWEQPDGWMIIKDRVIQTMKLSFFPG